MILDVKSNSILIFNFDGRIKKQRLFNDHCFAFFLLDDTLVIRLYIQTFQLFNWSQNKDKNIQKKAVKYRSYNL